MRAVVDQIGFDQRLADLFALREQKSIGHGAADDQHVDFLQQVAEQVELGGNLGAADDGRERTRRLVEHLLEGFQLRLQRSSRISRQQMRQPFGRGVRAVRHREGVVDENVAELGERGDESRIVLLLAGMEAGVLQADDVAVLHRRHRMLGGLADAVVDEFDRPLDDVRHLGGHRLERILLIASLRAAEMREQYDFGALVGDFGDGVRHALDAGGVGDHAVLDRNVEVDAHQHAFSLHVGMVEGIESRHLAISPVSLRGAPSDAHLRMTD